MSPGAVPGFQRQGDRGVARDPVRSHVALDPAGKGMLSACRAMNSSSICGSVSQAGGREAGGNAVVFGLRYGGRAALQVFPLGVDLAREFLDAERLYEDLDACLERVVAAAVAVVNAQDGFA